MTEQTEILLLETVHLNELFTETETEIAQLLQHLIHKHKDSWVPRTQVTLIGVGGAYSLSSQRWRQAGLQESLAKQSRLWSTFQDTEWPSSQKVKVTWENKIDAVLWFLHEHGHINIAKCSSNTPQSHTAHTHNLLIQVVVVPNIKTLVYYFVLLVNQVFLHN